MKKKNNPYIDIFSRYFLLIILAIPNLWLFYLVFTPLTLYPVYFLLSLFFEVSLNSNMLNFSNSITIEIISACIAGSAYYLLFILNMSVPKIKISKRLKMILFSFATLLIINILRILALSVMYINHFTWFDLAHKLFWYAGSIIFVLAIWFYQVKKYKIKEIPFYSDLKFLYKKITRK